MKPETFCLRPLLVATLLCTTSPALFAALGSWSTSGPAGGNVVALVSYEASPTTLWAAGRGGVFRSTSGGTSWTRIEIGLPEALFSTDLVAATSSPVVYLAAGRQIYRSGNGGDLWVPVTPPSAVDFINHLSLRRAGSNALLAASYNSLFVSSDGGGSWSAPGAVLGSNQYTAVDYAADGTLYAGLAYSDAATFSGAIVLRSTTGGASWAPTPAQPGGLGGIDHIVSSPGTPLRLFASDGVNLVTSSNGGSSWSGIALPEAGTACGVINQIAANPSVASGLIVGCSARGLLVTADATVASPVWQTYDASNGFTANGTQPPQLSAIAVHANFATTPSIWAGAGDGGLLATTTGGSCWSAINNGFQSTNIRALATHPVDTGNGAVFLAGYGDSTTTIRALYKSADSGGSWNPSNNGLNAEQIRSIAIDPTTVDSDPLTAENFTVYAAGRSERIPDAAAKDGGIYKSSNAGASWSTIDSGIAVVNGRPDMGTARTIALDPRSCLTPPASGPCVIGSGGLRKIFVTGGGRANLTAPGLPYQSARIYRSADAGASWTASDSGLPLPQDLGPPGSFNYASMGGVVPLVFDPGNTQTLYIGTFINWPQGQAGAVDPTLANGVFKSTDGGASWLHASNGLPRYAGAASSNWDVLALAINPANPQILYAGTSNLFAGVPTGNVYKTTNGGTSWSLASTGIAGQDVRALFIDPNDPTGDTVYAGTGGNGANPGGVYRTTNGGSSWNSISLGLPADSATALAMPRRAAGAAPRILAGTTAGVWDYTSPSDDDADGSPSAVENALVGGDGNGDGIQDSTQARVASLNGSGLLARTAQGGGAVTVAIQPGTCTQLNDSTSLAAALYPPDNIAGTGSHDAWGLASFSLPACAGASVRVTFHGASFGADWSWRNYGPRVPGNADTFGWYRFAGARLIDAQTWELRLDALRQGNYRDDANDILFVGGPAQSADLLFSDGLQ
ncbi:photosystem II stability/assembly factor-like uncharacterized protein [Tahibacter aquaticus]|uniref:Photosystem II stability/assembly factor-like uncharacterized protein n=1 Tax=Tahibacter aquaticus TaxID=520092 RepID=A0A4V3DNH4_9GAMM|nr:hypothetical protein [Tahibacter aquaticus]TDR48466.1 photosystem II stability/assembly factor-like uncharacterized protein [Tahibacter aquaticus]